MNAAEASAAAADRVRHPLRSDARHNHERILAVAREALTASADASLNSIAKKAGVGPGTLYRHFPSREALVLAVYEEDVRTLADSASELLAQHPPLQALRLFFDRLAAYGTIKRALADALRSASGDSLTDTTYAQVVGAVAQLLTACRRDGSIRPDIEADDVMLLVGFLWQIEPRPAGAERAARLLDLTVMGLQAGAPVGRATRRAARRSLRLPHRLAHVSLRTPRS
ncbi:MAG TPA: TetR/AcrR family transcriptional regulator [Streptosporangiaceae bacterium]|nr:TetR/AcrR family transcriptional regulator [Streptosporangiaceae bacterium]